jgi:uncharacterized membrane protein YedE/YeeE
MLIGTMLPFAKAFVFSVSMADGDDGVIVIGAAVVAGIAVFLRWYLFAIVVATVGALVAIIDMIDATDKQLDLGTGGFVIVLGALIAVVASAAAWSEKRKAARSASADTPATG